MEPLPTDKYCTKKRFCPAFVRLDRRGRWIKPDFFPFFWLQYVHLKCIGHDFCEGEAAIDGGRRRYRERDAALVRGRRVITIMRMDVFIMGCVSPPFQCPPLRLLLLLPLSLPGSLEQLRLRSTSGGPGPHLDAPQPRRYNLSPEGVCVCAILFHLYHPKQPLHLCG